MTFVQRNDAKGLREWLKRAVNALATHKWSKASACLNMLTDELSELTFDQGFPQGFVDYYSEHMEMRRVLPMQSDTPIDDAILRRKVTGVRRDGDGPSKAQAGLMTEERKSYVEQMQKMHQKIDLLETQLRRMTSDPRPSDFNRCYECDGEGHFGRDCPERAMKLARREAAKNAAVSGADKKVN